MKYSYNWLKELSGTKKSPEKVVEDLTMHSFEIEGVEKIEQKFPGVVVAEILEIRKHPNADKLQIVLVETRHASSLLRHEVVCGAWNIKVGDKVPLALVGTKLPNGIEIKEAEIRGIKSNGMLCAADELGLGKDHSGIVILDKNAKAGELVDKYLGFDDTIIEIKVLPDRAHDALSHVGVAREISVLEGRKTDYDFDGLKLPKFKAKSLKVEIKDKDLCSRYIGAVITDIEIKDSPKWMKERLRASGINSINNVVDATNYVMLELGQPLHAFDVAKLKTQKSNVKTASQNSKVEIVVRRARKNEKIELLDGENKELSENDLLITNGETPLALAGIKGGFNSGIAPNSHTIVLEAANFNAVNIRRTRTRLGIRTDSSDRFEKDIDPNLAEKAMVRAIEILEHIAHGKVKETFDVYPKPIKPWKIRLNLDYVNNLLGETVPVSAIKKILASLQFKVSGSGKNLTVEVPTFRIDARTQEDLIEEIGRIYGYDKIKPSPIVAPVEPSKINEQIFFERKAKEALSGLGFSEVYNYSFYSQKDAEICGFDPKMHLELENPMNPDQQLVRISLIPNVLKNIFSNLKYGKEIDIFELGRKYAKDGGKFPAEKRMLTVAQVKDDDANIFHDFKGSVEALLESLNIKELKFETPKDLPKIWHPTRTAIIRSEKNTLGIVGEINPSVLTHYKIKKRVAMAKFNMEILSKYASKDATYEQLRKYPTVTRDISLLDKSKLTVAEISEFIKKTGGELVLSVELFDIFQKDGVSSHAFHIHLGAARTLDGKEADEVMGRIIHSLEEELKVEVRK